MPLRRASLRNPESPCLCDALLGSCLAFAVICLAALSRAFALPNFSVPRSAIAMRCRDEVRLGKRCHRWAAPSRSPRCSAEALLCCAVPWHALPRLCRSLLWPSQCLAPRPDAPLRLRPALPFSDEPCRCDARHSFSLPCLCHAARGFSRTRPDLPLQCFSLLDVAIATPLLALPCRCLDGLIGGPLCRCSDSLFSALRCLRFAFFGSCCPAKHWLCLRRAGPGKTRPCRGYAAPRLALLCLCRSALSHSLMFGAFAVPRIATRFCAVPLPSSYRRCQACLCRRVE